MMAMIKQSAGLGKDFLGGTSPAYEAEIERSTLDIIEAANRDAVELTYRVERIVTALCGSGPQDSEKCANGYQDAVFPRLEERARDVSDRVKSANYELNRLEAIIIAK